MNWFCLLKSGYFTLPLHNAFIKHEKLKFVGTTRMINCTKPKCYPLDLNTKYQVGQLR